MAKLRPDGSNFEWFSYLGGAGDDVGYGITLDTDNNVFVTGVTDSLDFPTVEAPQKKFGGGTQDSFVAKISADGHQLIYATYLGGSGEEWGYSLAADSLGNVIAVGQTTAQNFPVRNAIQTTNASFTTDAYITKFTPAIEVPTLTIARSGAHVLIFWPTNFIGFKLQSTPSLGPLENWQPVTAAPLVLGGQATVIQPANATSQLFRLRRP